MSALEELDEQDLRALCQNLLRHIQTLINPQLPHTYSRWYISCALVSVSLLPLIRWRHDIDLSDFDRIIHSTTLVETISTFAFPTGQDNNASHDTPEWIHDQNNEGPRAHVFDTIHSWALAGNMEWSVFLKHENLWRKAIKEFWTDSFAQKTQHTSDNITGIGLLHHSSRLIARGALSSALQCHSSNGDKDVNGRYTNLLDSLFGLFGDTHSSVQLQAVCLVRTLLSDRKRLGTHDEISRSLWACIDDKIVQRVFHMLIRFPQTESSTRPLLLAIVDLFDTLLQDQQNCDVALKCLNSESLERMINLVVPKNVKFDYKDSAGWDDLSLDIASETPPANNLSRMDENSICIEKEDEGILRGVDTTIQLSFATVLARLAFNYSAINEEGIHLLKSRACTVVKDFVAQCLSHSIASASFDTSKRSFRLQLVVATSENEDFVSTTLYSAHVLNQKQYAHLKLERESAQQKLQDANRRSQDLEGQVTKLTNQNRSKSIVFKREMNRIKENTCQNAEQLVAIHARERSSVESRLGECRQQLEEARAHLETALRQADESQRMVNSTKDELQRTLIRTVDLEKENQNILRQIEQERTRARELEEEVQSKNQKLDTLFRKNEALEDDIQERDRTINECEAANENLRDNLEELFADMVSMATIYEAKEDEVVKLQRQHHVDIEKTESKLRRELERNGELTSTVDQLRLENDKLYRKLAKYKERLEDERRERQDEATRRKRNGPVSYMNQLHQSNSSDKNVRDRSSTRNDSRSNKSQLRAEKENNHWYSDSQRRKNS